MTPQFLRELAAHWRAIADAAWAAYYLVAGRGESAAADVERGLTIANEAQKLAYEFERKALRLEGERVVTS